MAKKLKTCQLYSYSENDFTVKKESPKYFAEEYSLEGISDGEVNWLNYHSIESQADIRKLLDNLKVHELVIEDIYEEGLRPKIEEYGHYIFFSIRSVVPLEGRDKALEEEQISFILGDHFLLSLQEKKGDHFQEVRTRIEQNKGVIRRKGVDFLIYRMLEAIVDNYYEVLDDIVQRSDQLEKKILNDSSSIYLKRIEFEKRRLAELRRVALPMRDLTSRLEKSSHRFINPNNHTYFSDLSDYCKGVLEEIDACKTVLEGQINLYFAVQGQRMNEIMKVLTVVSSIFIPLTFLAGIYGMNFDHIPELHFKYSYYILWGLMLVVAVLLYFYFRRKGWLKS